MRAKLDQQRLMEYRVKCLTKSKLNQNRDKAIFDAFPYSISEVQQSGLSTVITSQTEVTLRGYFFQDPEL